jgi:hypothetical protein
MIKERIGMIKTLTGQLAAASLLMSLPATVLAAPASEMLKPSGIANQEAVMKLPRCTKERTTECRVAKDGAWIAAGVLGLAALVALAAGSGGGNSASP